MKVLVAGQLWPMVDVVQPEGSGFAGAWTACAVSNKMAVPPWKMFWLAVLAGKEGVTVQVTGELVLVNCRLGFGVEPEEYQSASSFATDQQVIAGRAGRAGQGVRRHRNCEGLAPVVLRS